MNSSPLPNSSASLVFTVQCFHLQARQEVVKFEEFPTASLLLDPLRMPSTRVRKELPYN